MELMNKVYKTVGAVSNWVGKNAPAILSGLGIAGLATTGYLTYKAAPKVEKVVSDMEDAQAKGYEVDKAQVVRDVAGALALPLMVGTASAMAIAASWKIQNDRITVLGSTLSAVTAEYSHYRNKYAQTHGEEEGKKFFTETKKEVQTINSKGEEETKEVTKGERHTDMTGVWYSRSDSFLKDDHDYNQHAVRASIEALNAEIFKRGRLRVNDVYDMLNIQTTRQGALLGWTEANFSIEASPNHEFWDEEYLINVPDIRITWSTPEYIYK